MAKVYYEKDCDIRLLKNKVVGVIGYGAQGCAHASNLRDSGVKVVVGQRKGGDGYKRARKDGFNPVSAAEAVQQADVVMITLPDELMPSVYQKEIEPHLRKGQMLLFAHGFNIRFKQIVPPKTVDVAMIAPKGPGRLVRSEFVRGGGVACLVAVHQNATGKAFKLALAYARGIGGGRAGVIKTTFAEETETDLFGEQVVLCGGAAELVKAGFETLVKAGYQPEVCYFECMHELKLIVDLFYEGGLSWMNYVVSNTAEYGGLTRGKRVVTDQSRKNMQKILDEIRTGKFAKEWVGEYKSGMKKFKKLETADRNHRIEKVGAKLRRMMKFIDDKTVK